MVDVGAKQITRRMAHAIAVVALPPEVARAIVGGEISSKKGAVFQTAILAGIMGAKRTGELIPLCHPLPLDDCKIEIETRKADADASKSVEVVIYCHASTHARTGVEMEALTGASVAALAVYDMCKAMSHEIVIREVRLLEKTGGKSDFRAKEELK